jgi:hypothetical protein
VNCFIAATKEDFKIKILDHDNINADTEGIENPHEDWQIDEIMTAEEMTNYITQESNRKPIAQ